MFDIARGSIHDGPGLRTTVFLKGCGLRCAWCHNPESQSFTPQLSYNDRLCIGCGQCLDVCPAHAHRVVDGVHVVDFDQCRACGQCAAACPAEALKMYGKSMSPEEVWEIVARDIPFYEQSGGGVTLSGGEPLLHETFCTQVLTLCREHHVHTCIETGGMGDRRVLEAYAPLTDLFLYDWKVSSDAVAEKYIGASTRVIRENLEWLLDNGANVLLRCPLIPDVNDTPEHFAGIASWLDAYPNLSAELLPYHNFGIGKSRHIGVESAEFAVPTQEQKDAWIAFFRPRYADRVKI